MGLYVDGVWHDQWYDTAKSDGRFEREPNSIRNFVTPDGSPARPAKAGFRLKPAVIIFMSASPALGRTARSFSAR